MLRIKPARVENCSTIAAIYNEYIVLGTATMEETLKSPQDIELWNQHFNDREKLYILENDNQIIGWGIIKRYSDREGYRFACETAVYLTAGERGKGYGTFLKKYIIQQCRILKYRHLVAKIFASNKTSIKYNLKLGYTIVGTQNKIGFRNNQWQDVVIMQLLLEDKD